MPLRRTTLAQAAMALLAVVASVVLGHGLANATHRAPDTIDTFAGAGALDADGIRATDASLPFSYGIAVNTNGDLFISDAARCTVRKVSHGWISTVVGNGVCGYGGDGGPATEASLSGRAGLTLDAAGNLFVADTFNCAVRRVDVLTGIIATVAGGRCGGRLDDGALATEAFMLNPLGLAVHPNGDLYIADTMTCRVRRVSAGIITTVAGQPGIDDCTFSGDGGPASEAELNGPEGLAIDAVGDLYIADRDNCRIRRVSGGMIDTVAGTGSCSYNGDGPAHSTSLNYPFGITFDRNGDLLIADAMNCLVRRLRDGAVTTVAGFQGSIADIIYTQCGYNGDDQPAVGAMLGAPIGIASDAGGNIYLSEIDSLGNAASARVRIVYGETPPVIDEFPPSATATPAPTDTPLPADTPAPEATATPTATITDTPAATDTPEDAQTATPTNDGRAVVCHWVPAAPRDPGDLPGPEGGSYQVIVVDDDGADGNAALQAHEQHERDIIGSDETCGADTEPSRSAILDSSMALWLGLAVGGAAGLSGAHRMRRRLSPRR